MTSGHVTGCVTVCLQWEGGRVVNLGWTSAESLLIVMEDGSLASYTIHGQQLYSRILTRVSVCTCMCGRVVGAVFFPSSGGKGSPGLRVQVFLYTGGQCWVCRHV